MEDTLTDISDFEVELQSEVKTQGYLGEKTNRKDDIYNGVRGKLTLHLHDQAYFTFLQAILDRQKRNTPDVVFNISGIAAFPNGQTPTLLINDAKFGSVPITTSSRGDYTTSTLDFEADDIEFALS